MVAEITPPPSGARTPRTLMLTCLRVAIYGAGLIASTTAVGMIAGTIGLIVGRVASDALYHPAIGVVATISVAYGLHELAVIRLPAPENRWQVPVDWVRYGKLTQLLLYGLVLGAEVFTFIPYASFYVILLFDAALGPMGGLRWGSVTASCAWSQP